MTVKIEGHYLTAHDVGVLCAAAERIPRIKTDQLGALALGQPHDDKVLHDEVTMILHWSSDLEARKLASIALGRLIRGRMKGRHPQIQQLEAAEQHYSPKIKRALRFNTRVTARTGRLPNMDQGAMKKIFHSLYHDGYFIGYKAGHEHVKSLTRAEGDSMAKIVSSFNWDNWQPGNEQAASLLGDGGPGLQRLLDDSGVTIASIDQTTMQEISATLEQMTQQGSSTDQIAAALGELVGEDRSDMIARTELARAVGAATEDSYSANGVQEFNWMITDDDITCPDCQAEADGGPYEVGVDEMPPLHPNCRCATTAVSDSIQQPDGFSDEMQSDEEAG